MGRNLTITSLLVFVELECRKMRAKKPTPLSCSEGKGEWGVESFCKLVYKRNVKKILGHRITKLHSELSNPGGA